MALLMHDLAGAGDDYRFSPYCWRVRYYCAHKGLDLQTRPWRFGDRAQLPVPNQGTVPVLVDDSHVVSDSWDIALHLDERYPARPLFEGPQSRAQGRLIKLWVERGLHPFITRMTVRDTWAGLHPDNQGYFRQSREQRLGRPLEAVVGDREQTRVQFAAALDPARAMLDGQPFLGGAHPAFADYVVFGCFMWARCVSAFDVLDAADSLNAWREHMLNLYGGLGRRAVRSAAIA